MSEIIEQKIQILEKRVKDSSASPLFAQLAAYYLEIGRLDDALRVCDTGLAHHPFYTTGHLIKGKVLLALNMPKEAQRELEFVASFFPTNEEIKRLLQSVASATIEGDGHNIPSAEEAPTTTAVPSEATETIPAGWGGILSIEDVEPSQPSTTEQMISQTYDYTPSVASEQTTYEPDYSIPSSTESPVTTEDTYQSTFEHTYETSAFPSTFEFMPTVGSENIQSSETTIHAQEQKAVEPLTPEEFNSFELFASRIKATVGGENTLTINDFFNSTESSETELQIPANVQTESEPSPFFSTSFFESNFTSEESSSFTAPTDLPTDAFGSSALQEPPVFNPPFATETTVDDNPTIEDLTEKLQGAGKITPIIDFTQRETPVISDQDSDSGTGFVTPTLAEIYAKHLQLLIE